MRIFAAVPDSQGHFARHSRGRERARYNGRDVRRRFSLVLLFAASAIAAPQVQAAAERTLKARVLEIDGRRDLLRADVRGRPTVYRVADSALLRGFRKGDLVLLRVRGGRVVDVRLAVLTAEVVRADERSAVLRVRGREERFALGDRVRGARLRRGDFVRFEVEERRDGTRVVTRVF
jgi:hypothetical protein